MRENISNNIDPNKIYKRAGLSEDKFKSYVPKAILNNRDRYETKLSMALLSPKHNAFKIAKYQRILTNIEDMIRARNNEVVFHE